MKLTYPQMYMIMHYMNEMIEEVNSEISAQQQRNKNRMELLKKLGR